MPTRCLPRQGRDGSKSVAVSRDKNGTGAEDRFLVLAPNLAGAVGFGCAFLFNYVGNASESVADPVAQVVDGGYTQKAHEGEQKSVFKHGSALLVGPEAAQQIEHAFLQVKAKRGE
jgi:hypothetical protein